MHIPLFIRSCTICLLLIVLFTGNSLADSPKCPQEMVLVPAGAFAMGQAHGDKDERPVHDVHLGAFCMDLTPVTNSQYAAFLNEMGNRKEGGKKWLDTDCLECPLLVRIKEKQGAFIPKSGYADHPAIKVSWYGAKAYCERAGKMLPTEAQWEKAARGGLAGKKFPWGDSPDDKLANINGKNTTPVKSFPPNGYGLYDMAGNVWEWVEDWYDPRYYSRSPESDPRGPAEGELKVLRGGSWFHPDSSRCAQRASDHPRSDVFCFVTGFRCVREPIGSE